MYPANATITIASITFTVSQNDNFSRKRRASSLRPASTALSQKITSATSSLMATKA